MFWNEVMESWQKLCLVLLFTFFWSKTWFENPEYKVWRPKLAWFLFQTFLKYRTLPKRHFNVQIFWFFKGSPYSISKDMKNSIESDQLSGKIYLTLYTPSFKLNNLYQYNAHRTVIPQITWYSMVLSNTASRTDFAKKLH